MIKAALWLIAACEVVRLIQNERQLHYQRKGEGRAENAYAEFVKSLKRSDADFVKAVLEEFEKQEEKE